MAKEFLKLVAELIHERYKDNVEKLCIVLPNKRGALFDLFADGIVGFEFRNKEEAEIFALKVRSVSPKNE